MKNLEDLYSSFTFFNKKIEDGLIDLFDYCVIDAEKNKNLYDEEILELLIKFPVVSKHFKDEYIFISNYDNYTKPLVSKFSRKVTKIYLENTNSFLKFDVYNFQTYSELIKNDIEIFIPKGSKSLLKQLKSLSEATQKINTFSKKENESFVKFQKYLDFFIRNTIETDNIFNTNFYLKKNN